jgi:hypothetical protein
MGFTKTIHPPAGATALLCSTTPEITELGWFMLPLVLLGSVLLVATACVMNNIQRRFPVYWWTPAELRRPEKEKADVERASEAAMEVGNGDATEKGITIDAEQIIVPDWLGMEDEEQAMLEILRIRLREGIQIASSRE